MVLEELYKIFKKSTGICIDTRLISKDCIFWGLPGSNFDGGSFAEEALKKGALLSVRQSTTASQDPQIIHTENALTLLQDLARLHRSQFEIPIIAITGSNGKTTTKELVSTVLSSHYNTHSTKGNYNNHLGVPLTILQMPEDTEIAVIEMGANAIGEIRDLCYIAHPTCGLITNIGKAHLEGFGSIEGIKKAKSELYEYLETNRCWIFVNMDEPELVELSAMVQKKIQYAQKGSKRVNLFTSEVLLETTEPYLQVSFNSTDYGRVLVNTQLVGSYNFPNIMTAIVIGQYFKVPDQKIKEALENYISTNNRSQIIQKGNNTIVLDAYNANPSSMQKAIENLLSMQGQKKLAILGDMFELGNSSISEHQSIVNYCKSSGLEKAVFVGPDFQQTVLPDSYLSFKDIVDAKDWFVNQEIANTTILIKGSRGMKMETLIN